VAFSITSADLEEARVVQERQGVRYVAGKSFNQQGSVTTAEGTVVPFWVDTRYDAAMPVRTIPFGSAQYFALAVDPQVAQWLSLSPEMMLVLNNEVIRVTVQAGEAGDNMPLPSPSTVLTSTRAGGNVWWASSSGCLGSDVPTEA
jgi:hypothetical protein